jgi:tetratricopeptide (TPR) repeat protein
LFRALVFAVCAFAQSSPDYDRGVALFEKGAYAEALPFLDRAARADPTNAQKWKAVGVTHAALKNYLDAEETLARACRLDDKVPDACFFHARALYALDRYEEALAALERAGPRDWRVRLARAESLSALGRSSAAEQEFQTALALCRNADPKPAVAYARFLIREARAAEAIPRLQETLAAHPANPDAPLYLGRALFDANKLSDALPHLERAAALNPASAQAHLLLAKLYLRLNRPADAQPHLDLAAKYGEEK